MMGGFYFCTFLNLANDNHLANIDQSLPRPAGTYEDNLAEWSNFLYITPKMKFFNISDMETFSKCLGQMNNMLRLSLATVQ